MLKEFLDIIFHCKLCISPLLRYLSSNIGETSGVNELKREVPVIVSLSSKEENFDDLELALYSLCNQKVCPDRIILWLKNEYELSELPYSITRFIKNGLEIRFVGDKAEYTRIIYTLKEFDKSIIVTACDNIYYPSDWLKKLYHSYISSPSDIHAHMVSKVKINSNKLASYKVWKHYNNSENADYLHYAHADGGVLYPPNCFTKEIFREDIYKKKAKADWNTWSWFMAAVSGRKIRVVKNHIERFSYINFMRLLKEEYIKIKQFQKVDNQIKKLMEYYGQNIYQRLDL